jgi:hypothetical protein
VELTPTPDGAGGAPNAPAAPSQSTFICAEPKPFFAATVIYRVSQSLYGGAAQSLYGGAGAMESQAKYGLSLSY